MISCLYFWFWMEKGSGFISSRHYQHGFFSARIKLPAEYTAGICVAFYVSYFLFLFCIINDIIRKRFNNFNLQIPKSRFHLLFTQKAKIIENKKFLISFSYKQTSNADVFEKSHDELDFEFLGNVEGKPWRFQTNLYGNGSTSRGREERYRLWFDPTKEFHRYSILWTANAIV